MDQALKELKRQEDKQFSVFDDITKELKGCTVYFSKTQR